jgi:hypothetical protein
MFIEDEPNNTIKLNESLIAGKSYYCTKKAI